MPNSSQAGENNQSDQPPPPATTTMPVKPLHTSREISPRQRIISLAFGDALCFVVFASLGTSQHNEGFNLLYNLWIALPFLLSWFLISPFIGVFRADVATKPAKMATRTVLAWLCTWPVAMFIRWLLVDLAKGTSFAAFLPFAIVALLFNAGLLLLWRWPFAWNNNLRKRGI